MNKNELYPIFLKASELNILIVGGGKVGLEKLTFLLKSSPNARVSVLAENFIPELKSLTDEYMVDTYHDSYNSSFLNNKHIVVAATDNMEINLKIHKDAKAKNILVNVADNPDYCDFYMGGIVTKGNLKLAISTNGKSPTMAKRLRQFFEEVLPEELDELTDNLNRFRNTLKEDFEGKVKSLNELTKSMINKKDPESLP